MPSSDRFAKVELPSEFFHPEERQRAKDFETDGETLCPECFCYHAGECA